MTLVVFILFVVEFEFIQSVHSLTSSTVSAPSPRNHTKQASSFSQQQSSNPLEQDLQQQHLHERYMQTFWIHREHYKFNSAVLFENVTWWLLAVMGMVYVVMEGPKMFQKGGKQQLKEKTH